MDKKRQLPAGTRVMVFTLEHQGETGVVLFSQQSPEPNVISYHDVDLDFSDTQLLNLYGDEIEPLFLP